MNGKVLRLNPDGTIPEDNPIPGSPVFALGLRNPFGMVIDQTEGTIYVTENGPECCDEVNRIKANSNYGWPVSRGRSPNEEFEQPIFVWEKTIAPTIPAFISTNRFGADLKGSLVVGAFNTGEILLFRPELLADPGSGEPEVIYRLPARPIGVFEHPSGELYVTTFGQTVYRITELQKVITAELDFRDDPYADFLGAGWSAVETHDGPLKYYRWTYGRAEATLPIVSVVGDGELVVSGRVQLAYVPEESLTITAYLNGDMLGSEVIQSVSSLPSDSCTYSNCFDFVVSFPVLRNTIEVKSEPEVTLEVEPVFVPAEVISTSKDSRSLGVRVYSVALVQPEQ